MRICLVLEVVVSVVLGHTVGSKEAHLDSPFPPRRKAIPKHIPSIRVLKLNLVALDYPIRLLLLHLCAMAVIRVALRIRKCSRLSFLDGRHDRCCGLLEVNRSEVAKETRRRLTDMARQTKLLRPNGTRIHLQSGWLTTFTHRRPARANPASDFIKREALSAVGFSFQYRRSFARPRLVLPRGQDSEVNRGVSIDRLHEMDSRIQHFNSCWW
jgi:hypothetical protein